MMYIKNSLLAVVKAGSLIMATAMIGTTAPAMAAVFAETITPYNATYNVTTPYRIDSIVLADYKTNGNSLTNSFSVFPPNYTITNPFVQTTATISTFFFGTSFLDNDADEHLVLGLNNGFSATLIGQNFSDVFTGFTEAQIISAADTLDRPGTRDEINAALNTLFSFSDYVNGAGGGFALGDGFSLTAFSTGQPAGTGLSAAVPAVAAAVPEPATWTMMLAGFGALGVSMRSRRRTMTPRLA